MTTRSTSTASASALHAAFDALSAELTEAVQQAYGSRLVGLGVFGSVGGLSMRPDSDIDVLIVAEPLPVGRMARSREFDAVERSVAGSVEGARRAGVATRLSPVFKTPE